jgi:hypothetical protein
MLLRSALAFLFCTCAVFDFAFSQCAQPPCCRLVSVLARQAAWLELTGQALYTVFDWPVDSVCHEDVVCYRLAAAPLPAGCSYLARSMCHD